MIEVKGKYGEAKIYTDLVEQSTISQIYKALEYEFAKDSHMRIMPDCHTGAGCTIGTTMRIKDKVVPNLVGVDIGCGMHVVLLGNVEIDLKELDEAIKANVPAGFSVREYTHKEYAPKAKKLLAELKCRDFEEERVLHSVGTLGGGNHFIELNIDDEGAKFLVIHSGSRNLGKQVAEFYQKAAARQRTQGDIKPIIERLKREGKQKEIQNHLQTYRTHIPKELCWLEGDLLADYLHDMKLVQEFANLNRLCMARVIQEAIKVKGFDAFSSVHNYIDIQNMILRKGAVSAQKDELLIIPINMRDGSLICIGKGNPEWNYSAPHGAGRLMSRSQAKASIKLKDFEESMKGIYTTTANESTLDESAFAYKPIESITDNIKDSVDIIKIIKPIYNFKSSDGGNKDAQIDS